MKHFIICLVGESGSGKSTIANLLEKRFNFTVIKSYTTRPKRNANDNDHVFVTIQDFEKIPKENIVAYTEFDGHFYWTTREQFEENKVSVFVCDVNGIFTLKNYIKTYNLDWEVFIVYIKSDSITRYERMCKRMGLKVELSEFTPEHEKILRRIEYDKKAFKYIPCNLVVDNHEDVNDAVNYIIQFFFSYVLDTLL